MSAHTTICEKCGNEISKWDDGVCVHCLSKGNYKNLGGEWKVDSPKQPSTANSIRVVDIDKIIGTDWKVWLDNFNYLLEDIYWKNMRFSQMLQSRGISDDKITTWKHDSTWLIRFFNALDKKITTIVVNKFPKTEHDIFNAIYGVSGRTTNTIYKVAEEYNISVQEVIVIRQKIIQFFKGWNGKTELETAIFESVILANDMEQIYKKHSDLNDNDLEDMIEFDDEYEEYINLFEIDNQDEDEIY